ncbi:putative membrane protein [Hymenobacter sp. UYAg731]
MSRKFLDTESPGWVTDGLISEAQRQLLLARYPQEVPALGLLPILGSVLVGLSGLSVVAANWQGLPTALRLALLLGSLMGSYGAGSYFLRRGNPDLGHGLIGLGLLLFGASIILTSQLFQLVGYDASGLLAWVIAGGALSYVYGSRLLVLLTVLIGAAVQTYCVESLGIFSYVTAWLVVGGMGYYWWRRPDTVSATVLAVGLLWQAGLFIIVQHSKITWFFVPAMLVYAAGDWQPNRAGGRALQVPSLVAAYLFMFGLAIFGEADAYANILRPPLLPYLGALAAVLAISVAGKRARGRLGTLPEWLLLLPGFYLSGGLSLAVATLVVLYAHAGSVLARANRDHDPEQLTIGAVLFVAATAVAYFKLTWGFMDKSLFFLIGGILLLALSWYLRRRNAQVLAAAAPLVAQQAGTPPVSEDAPAAPESTQHS